MPNSSETTPEPALSALDLRIGQTLQLITQGPQPRKYFTQLIGYVEHEFIMARVPEEKGWTVPFNPGESLDVRVFCGVSLYEFESRLQTVLHHPRNYMLLNCPERIRQTRLRSHERVKCALPVQIAQAPSGPVPAGAYAFHDLSGSGAALVGPVALGQPGQPLRLQLAFDLAATGTHEQLTLLAHIQTVQPLRNGSGQTTGFQHGILFEQVEPRILLLVNELQKPQAY